MMEVWESASPFFRTVENGDGDTIKEGVEAERRPRVMTLRLAENKLESKVSRESDEVDRDCHDWWSLGGRRRSHDMDKPALH